MPKEFSECRKKGGKIRTKKLPDGRYQYLCILGDKIYPGEIHSPKGSKKK